MNMIWRIYIWVISFAEIFLTMKIGIPLIINPNNPGDKQLIIERAGRMLPAVRQLWIQTMELFTPQERDAVCRFFEGGVASLRFLTLNTGSDQFDNLDVYIDSLCPVLEKVTDEIFLYAFTMSPETLVKVINHSYNWKRLVLNWGKFAIGPDDILDFDPTLDFKIQSMSFYYSLFENDNGHMDVPQFNRFVQALSYTSLVDSLRHVQAGGSWNTPYIGQHNLTSAFQSNGFTITYEERWSQPMDPQVLALLQ